MLDGSAWVCFCILITSQFCVAIQSPEIIPWAATALQAHAESIEMSKIKIL